MGLKTTSEEAAGAVNQQQIKAKLLGTGMTKHFHVQPFHTNNSLVHILLILKFKKIILLTYFYLQYYMLPQQKIKEQIILSIMEL